MTEELKVCRKCHLEQKLASFTVVDKRNGRRKTTCRTCEAARIKAYYDSTPERQEMARKKSRDWRKANMDRSRPNRRATTLKCQYGITTSQFEELLRTQGGKCALCRAEDHGRSTVPKDHWMVDHNHETGEVRGLLCNSCNTALGHYEKLMSGVGEVAVLDYLTRPCPVPPLPPAIGDTFVPRYVGDIPGAVLPICSAEGCTRDARWGDLCHTHHMNKFRARVLQDAGAEVVLHQRGETQWKTTLTDDQVRAIRASTKKGIDLAVDYNVSTGCISAIRTRRTWKHVPDEPEVPAPAESALPSLFDPIPQDAT